MMPLKEYLSQCGFKPDNYGMTIFFRACFDESGTDQDHDHAVAAGCVAIDGEWGTIENEWNKVLANSSYKLRYFHAKDFNDLKGQFKGWSRFKSGRFSKSVNKIIQNSNAIYLAAAVDKSSHKEVKKKIQELRFKGAKVDSDFGMCFRAILGDLLQKFDDENIDAKVKIVVEDGPYSDDAYTIYFNLKNKWSGKYSRLADMLNGFFSAPKGSMRGLEIADFLADKALKSIDNGTFLNLRWPNEIARIVNRETLEELYKSVAQEKQRRRAYGSRSTFSDYSGDSEK